MCGHHHHSTRHILCLQCDMLVALPPLQHGHRAACPRCGATLTTEWEAPRQRSTAYALVALFMLLLSNLFPFVNMQMAGIASELTLLEIPGVMFSEDYASLATLFMLFVQLVPAFCLATILLLVNWVRMDFRLKIALARALFQLKSWGMAEIFLSGALVSFVKLMAYAYADVGIGSSFIPWCLFCLLQLRAFQCVDRHWLWNDIAPAPTLEQAPRAGITGIQQGLRSCPCCTAIVTVDNPVCPRCHTRGYARRRNSIQWTLALLVTAIMLYLPANILPIMITDLLGDPTPSTILTGVVLLWSDGSYPVALVIFIASIMVPTLKMIGVAWLCLDAKGYGRRDSERMLFIYEVVGFVGRWSMIDVFVIAVLSALVRIGGLINIYPAMGALMFALVVIIMMFAEMTFDPRLSWDRELQMHDEESLEHGE